jgi:hypothetical protein
MLQIDSNIRVRIASSRSDDFVQMAEDNGVACYYVTSEGDTKIWELVVDGSFASALGDFLKVVGQEFE